MDDKPSQDVGSGQGSEKKADEEAKKANSKRKISIDHVVNK